MTRNPVICGPEVAERIYGVVGDRVTDPLALSIPP
jgi:hypothetical protein